MLENLWIKFSLSLTLFNGMQWMQPFSSAMQMNECYLTAYYLDALNNLLDFILCAQEKY